MGIATLSGRSRIGQPQSFGFARAARSQVRMRQHFPYALVMAALRREFSGADVFFVTEAGAVIGLYAAK
jgi:hypothetical protein